MKQFLQILFTATVLIISANSRAQNWSRIVINTDSIGSNPFRFLTIGNISYFFADDGAHGYELWRSDGTTAGTILLKDINPGSISSGVFNMINLNGVLLFGANDSTHGQELWRSDGTPAGTVMVKDIYPGASSGYINYVQSPPVVLNNLLYFVGTDPTNGAELWKTDGTAAGTVLVKDINPGAASFTAYSGIAFNGQLYFTCTVGGVSQFWKTDGTAAGTVMVSNTSSAWALNGFAENSSRLFMFNGASSALWTTDGTATGATLLKNVTTYPSTLQFKVMGETVFFAGNDGVNGMEVWKTDGTVAGTVMVKDINVGAGSSSPNIGGGVVLGSQLYFVANDSVHGMELWRTNGTAAGTVMVKDINPGTKSGLIGYLGLSIKRDTLYFSADDGVNGSELWQSDGTESHTVMAANIMPGAYSGFPSYMTALTDSIMLLTATDGSNGMELWKSNGTQAGTQMLSNIKAYPNELPAGSLLINGNTPALAANNGLYFTGTENRYGGELYFTSGTTVNTHLVSDLLPGSSTSYPSSFTQVNNTVYFAASNDQVSTQIFQTDGTTAGTTMVPTGMPVSPYLFTPSTNNLTNVNGSLFFTGVNNNTRTYGVYKTDGTTAGTVALTDGIVSTIGVATFYSMNNNTTVFVLPASVTYGGGLWKTDGTRAGTTQIKSMNVFGNNLKFMPLLIGSTLYFTGNDANGAELWKTDGTAAGTVLVKDINSGSSSSYPDNLTNINGTLYFTATDASGIELWKTDGTAAGTVLVKGNGCGAANLLVGADNVTLYFTATDATNGTELWKTDGTVAGTVLVKDIVAGTGSSNPSQLLKLGNYVFFFAQDASSAPAYSLFRTDGTASGTIKMSGLPVTLTPFPLYASGSNLYAILSISNSSVAYQLWSTVGSTVLPVQLLGFTAQPSKNDAICNWQTTHEINTDHFTVERSTDGSHFTAIGSVNAQGNGASATQSYTYTDYNAKQLQYTTLYYRLQSVDKDGSYSYSNTVAVSFTDNTVFSVLPNPATSRITIKGNNLVSVHIIDNTGKAVVIEQANNSNNLTIDISHLAKGLYFVQMKDSKGNLQTEKVVVE